MVAEVVLIEAIRQRGSKHEEKQSCSIGFAVFEPFDTEFQIRFVMTGSPRKPMDSEITQGDRKGKSRMGIKVRTMVEYNVLQQLVEKNMFIGSEDVVPGLKTDGSLLPSVKPPSDPTPLWQKLKSTDDCLLFNFPKDVLKEELKQMKPLWLHNLVF